MDWARGEVLSQGVSQALGFVLPAGLSVLTAVGGLFSEVPFPYVMAAATAVFGFGAFAANQISVLLFMRSVRWKLDILEPRVARLLDEKGDLDGIKIGAYIRNTALFPVQFHVETIKSMVGSTVAQNPVYENRTVVLGPTQDIVFWDYVVSTRDLGKGQKCDAIFEISIAYGREGKLTFPLSRKYKLILRRTDNDDVLSEWFAQ